jgi:hypothetical protein
MPVRRISAQRRKAGASFLAADRTSCCRASANQMRLFLHVGAYWALWKLRT